MAAPALAALPAILKGVSRIAGPALRGQGGKMMASGGKGSQTASFGSQLMKVTDDKLFKVLTELTKTTSKSETKQLKIMEKANKMADTAIRTFYKINSGIGKIVGTLAKHSPALQQQLIVLGRSFSLFLRPIGDILARWLRPMAQWLIKVAMIVYNAFNKGDRGMDLEDKMKQIDAQIDVAKREGRDEDVKRLEQEKYEILKMYLDYGTAAGKGIEEMGNNISKVLGNTGVNLDSVLASLISVIPGGEKLLQSALGDLAFNIDEDGNKVPKTFEEIVDALKTGDQSVLGGIGSLIFNMWGSAKRMKTILEYLNNFKLRDPPGSGTPGDGLHGRGMLPDMPIWGDVRTYNEDSIPGLTKDFAVGGAIQKSGSYNLHAGERVLTAGSTARSNNSGSTSINNHFTINATINNDLDIRELARKLADYNEVELRRRVSYG